MSAKKILIIDDDEHLLLGLAAKLKATAITSSLPWTRSPPWP